jgi:hypothetical protein
LSTDPFEILRRNLKADADAQLRQAGKSRDVPESIFARANAAIHTPAAFSSEILAGLGGDPEDSQLKSSNESENLARPPAPPTSRNPSVHSTSPCEESEGCSDVTTVARRITETKLDSPRLWRKAVEQTEAEAEEHEPVALHPSQRQRGLASMGLDAIGSGNP